MKLQPIYVLLAAALLTLGACTNTKAVRVGDSEALAAEKRRADAAEAALAALRKSLEPGKDNAERRERVENAQNEVKQVRERVADQPNSPAKTAALTALGDVDEALKAIDDLLEANAALSSAVPASLTSMHTELDQALAALDTAQASLTAALAAEPSTEIKTLLAQAQAALSTAQVSLVPELRRELAVVQERADAEKERADAEKERADAEKERADTYDPRVTLNDALEPARAARTSLAASLTSKGPVAWTARTRTVVSAGVTTVVALDNDIQDEAVLWADGKRLGLGVAGPVSTDEFQLRGITVRGIGGRGQQDADGAYQTADGTGNPPVMGRADAGAWRNWNAAYESSIRMNADGDGITLKMGGDGTIFYDFEVEHSALGSGGAAYEAQNQPEGATCAVTAGSTPAEKSAGKCDDAIARDVTATFGTPVADPDGEAAWHFRTRVPVSPDTPHTETRDLAVLESWSKFRDDEGKTLFQVRDPNGPYEDEDEDGKFRYRVERAELGSQEDGWKPLEHRRALRIARGRPVEELGVYNTWLSNYAGEDSYLQYAAYGLFNFLDYSTTKVTHVRMQAFHFGYDAFADEDDRRPADWGTADDPVEATFKGRTTGWMMQRQTEIVDEGFDLIRLRGAVELTANLNAGGGDGHGTVSGFMKDFEFLQNGVWTADAYYRYLENEPADAPAVANRGKAVLLESADIGADGSFSGVAHAAHNGVGFGEGNKNFAPGQYGGAFYGPRELGELEAAGHWYLPRADDTSGSPHPGTGAILGSFGAKSEE